MKRLALTMMCVLSVCARAASAAEPATKPATPEPEVRRFELTPVAPPTPAMKYHLMFNFAERIPGNAAITYAGTTMLLKPDTNDTAEKALDALAANDEQGFAKL